MSSNPSNSGPTPEEEESLSSWALCILCMLLIGALWMSYYLQVRRIRAIHETVVSIFAGMVVGLILRLSPGHMIREMITFKHTLFFNLLLPPIILNSGYELKQENFFKNFGVILTFAFAGTFISAVGLGVLVYLWSFTGLEGLKFTLLECLIFGSTLSATDPVTIISIFNSYKVDPKLFSIIFGESLLNDAVSIVLYETLSQFHGNEGISVGSLFHGVAIFLLQFTISMALGVIFALACSLVLKHSKLGLYPGIESCIITLVAFTSYFMSTGLHMSGIVSLLFCGITLKHYAYHSMSRRTQRTTKYMFAILAQLSENFIFIYLGLNLFAQDILVFKPLFILITTVSVMAARYAAVFPLSEIINWIYHARGQRAEELPHSYQMMLFWSGLRGAVGVALAVGIKGENANALRTTVLVVVVITVIVFGGTTARMLEVLGIRVGVEDEDASSDDEAGGSHWNGPMALENGPGSRRFAGQNGRSLAGRSRRGVGLSGSDGEPLEGYEDIEDGLAYGADGGARMSPLGTPANLGGAYRTSGAFNNPPRSANASLIRGFSTTSSSEEDGDERSDDGELFPPAQSNNGSLLNLNEPASRRSLSGGSRSTSPSGTREGMVFRDGQWFTALDERYLLPLFSNSVASRRHHAKKAANRRASGRGEPSGTHSPPLGGGDLEDGEDLGDEYYEGEGGAVGGDVDSENGKNTKWKAGGGMNKNFSGSVADFFQGFTSSTPPSRASDSFPSAARDPLLNPPLSAASSGDMGVQRASGSGSGSGVRPLSAAGGRVGGVPEAERRVD